MLDEVMLDEVMLLKEKCQFWRHGYVLIKSMFTSEEMSVVKRKIISIDAMNKKAERALELQADGQHPSFDTIFVWNDVDGNDLFAKAGKSYKILDRLSFYFEDDVYNYHNKVILKYPGVVGMRPHQDYGYWRDMGCRWPEAHAAFIAVDDMTEQNGCLAVAPNSHLIGNLPHSPWTECKSDHGIQKQVFEEVLKLYPMQTVEMKSGDVILFHGNTIHGSGDNTSDRSRIALVATMNTKRNSPNPAFNRSGHPYWSKQARIAEPITEADLDLPLPNFNLKF